MYRNLKELTEDQVHFLDRVLLSLNKFNGLDEHDLSLRYTGQTFTTIYLREMLTKIITLRQYTPNEKDFLNKLRDYYINKLNIKNN